MKAPRTAAALALLLLAAAAFASNLWTWVLDFDPAFKFPRPGATTGAPLTRSVTILLIDGLRLDASRRMPGLNALRLRGADVEATVGTPSFSRPGRATLVVGAPPSVHGVTTNRQKRGLRIDNLLKRVIALGGACRIAGSAIWPGLLAPEIALCGEAIVTEGKEGPGAFARQVPIIRAEQKKAIDFILAKPAMIRIADIVSTDFAAHEYGGSSPQYAAETALADGAIQDLASRLDLASETLVITADHGHRDLGGHGGDEAEVLTIPTVMVGAGIRPGAATKGDQADLGPTIAALLGASLPMGSSGRPLETVLAADEAKLAMVRTAATAQQQAFREAVAERLGVRAQSAPAWGELVAAALEQRSGSRLWIAISLAGALVIGAGTILRREGATLSDLLAGSVMAALVYACLEKPTMSFSAINYDDMLLPFFRGIMAQAAMVAAAGSLGAIGASRVRTRSFDRAAEAGGGAALVLGSAIFVALVGWWWRFGLLIPTSLPGPGRMVEAYALTLSLVSVSLAGLVFVLASTAFGGKRRRAS